jgi:hypothetical protein
VYSTAHLVNTGKDYEAMEHRRCRLRLNNPRFEGEGIELCPLKANICAALSGLFSRSTLFPQGSRPGLSCVAASRLKNSSPEGAQQQSPGREPWVEAPCHESPVRARHLWLFDKSTSPTCPSSEGDAFQPSPMGTLKGFMNQASGLAGDC